MKIQRWTGSVRSFSHNHRLRCHEQNFQVKPERTFAGIADVEPNHVVEPHAAATAYLPQAGDTWLRFQHAASVPDLICLDFVRNRRPWTDQ